MVIGVLACFGMHLSNAQTCTGDDITIQENNFPQTCVSTDPTDGVNTTETFTYEAGYSANSADDISVTMTAVCPPSTSGNGTTFIASCLGPLGLSTSTGADPINLNQSGGSDFGYTTINDGDCASCYVEVCYDFINGFSSNAAGLDIDWSSMNGGTEAQESFVGWIEGTNNTTGAALPTYSAAGFTSYCYADVLAGITAGQYLTGVTGALPAGSFAADAITGDGTATVCPNEEPASSAGPNSSVSTGMGAGVIPANWGFGTDDITVTKLCVVYFGSNNNTSDCNGDGVNEANSTPAGSLAAVDVCFAPPCGFPEPTVSLDAACGLFNFTVGTIDESGASGTGTTVSYSTAPQSPVANTTDLVTGAEGLAADGSTMYYIQICDNADATCCSEFGPFTAPFSSTANVPSFLPCTTGTTGIGGQTISLIELTN